MSSTKRLPLYGLLLTILLPAALLLAEGQNKIAYDRFDWQIYTSTHFQVFYYSREKDTLQKVVSMAESAYDELSRRLNFQINKPIPLIFYATHAEFEQNNIILGFIPEAVGAFAEPARNRMVLPVDMPDEKAQALIQHELTHVFEYEILFGGRLTRALSSNAPTWFMEGLASYLGNDEDEKDKMFLRDAVNSDLIPPITRVNLQGYIAYRYGHAVFDFIEAEWGKDAVRDFIFEYRSFLGRDVAVALKRAFEVDPDEFDLKFRRYLRKKYLPLLAVKGEASEYGERFRVGKYQDPSLEVGVAPSPSGDFVATFTTVKEDVDIALLSVKDRKLYKNLSAGKTTRYEYLVSQYLTAAPESGRDLAFAPDGDTIAVFARHERGRKLCLFSARKGGLAERIAVTPDVPLSPAFSPDGKSILFSGISKGNSRDIFLLDLASKTSRNLTNDDTYDAAPVYSPDGKYIYHQKQVGGLSKIVRFPVDDPAKIEQVTWGEGNDEDPAFSPDGKRIYFASSRGGIFNIYSQNLESGEIYQFTDVIGAAIGPAAFVGPDNQEKVVFSGFQGGRFQLYVADSRKPFKKLDEKALPPSALGSGATAGFVPAVEVAIDPEKVKRPKKFHLFLENAGGYVGVNSDQTFVSQVRLDFSDYLGDKRGVFIFDSVSTFSNFHLAYYNLARRFQWGIQAYDVRTYFVGVEFDTGNEVRVRRAYKETGLTVQGLYPLSRYTRLEANVGFLSRSLDVPYAQQNADGTQFQIFLPRKDNVPSAGVGFSYDATRNKEFGPHGGRRLDIHYQYTPDLTDGGTLTQDLWLDARNYLPITRRTLLANRLFAGKSNGTAPTVFYFGGLDTLRGYDFRTEIGNRVFYLNTELRFPLVDLLATPILGFQGVRGRIFVDIGGAWLQGEHFRFWNGDENRLENARASYGAGFSVYFLGLPWNVDFAKQWDFKHSLSSTQVTFYVGNVF